MRLKSLSNARRTKIYIALVFVAGIVLICVLFSAIKKVKAIESLYSAVNFFAKARNLSPYLIFAVISTESSFDETAVSEKGAVGLMQLMPETAAFIAKKEGFSPKEINLFDKETNVALGSLYIRYLIDKFQTLELALIAYNAGEGNVKKWLSDGTLDASDFRISDVPFPETRKYCKKVLRKERLYKILFENIPLLAE